MEFDTEKILQILVGSVGLLITGGGLKTYLDSQLAKRKADAASDQQVFDQSLSINHGLAVRVGVLEEGLKHCQDEHANCKYEMGLVRGQMMELQRQVDRNAQRIEETVAAASDSAILDRHIVGKMVGLGTIDTPEPPKDNNA